MEYKGYRIVDAGLGWSTYDWEGVFIRWSNTVEESKTFLDYLVAKHKEWEEYDVRRES